MNARAFLNDTPHTTRTSATTDMRSCDAHAVARVPSAPAPRRRGCTRYRSSLTPLAISQIHTSSVGPRVSARQRLAGLVWACAHQPAGLMRPHISRVHAPPTRTPKRPPPRPRSRLSRVLTVRAWPIPTARDHTHKRTHAHTHKGVPSRVVVVRASRRSRRAFARLPPRATPPFYLASE